MKKNIGSIYNHEYIFVEYDPMSIDEKMLIEVTKTFHVQLDIYLSREKFILGFSLDEEVFIGNVEFIIGQIELLIDKALTDEEFDILYRIYGMAKQLEQMRQVIKEDLKTYLDPVKRFK